MATTTATHRLDPNDNNAYLLYVPSTIFGILCPLFVSLRIISRLRRGGKTGPDDWTSIAATGFLLLLCASLVAASQYGMGRHFALIEPAKRYEVLKYFYLAQIAYKSSINLTKCSILLLYLRIFNQIRWFKWACWILIAIVSSYCIASVTATIFQCSPITRAFDRSIPGVCINNGNFWSANAGFSIASDIVIFLLPMSLVYQLQIPWAQKFALVGVFALGIFVVITSCLRVTTLSIFAESTNMTHDIVNIMWTVIEPSVAIICACLPSLRPLIVRLIPSMRSKGSKNKSYEGTRGYSHGTRSRPAAGESQGRDRNEWEDDDIAKSDDALPMGRIKNSDSASQDSMFPIHQPSNSVSGIHKTVEYTVQYSRG